MDLTQKLAYGEEEDPHTPISHLGFSFKSAHEKASKSISNVGIKLLLITANCITPF